MRKNFQYHDFCEKKVFKVRKMQRYKNGKRTLYGTIYFMYLIVNNKILDWKLERLNKKMTDEERQEANKTLMEIIDELIAEGKW